MDLTEFLTARLDEVERRARTCAEVFPPLWGVSDRGHSATIRAGGPSFHIVTELDQAQAPAGGWLGASLTHIARHDPAHVLREVAAKRAIVADFHRIEADGQHHLTFTAHATGLGIALRHLAAVYADHPDYDAAWRA